MSVTPTPTTNSLEALISAIKGLISNPGKSVEKLGLYVVGSLTAANVINVGNFRPWLVSSIAGLLGAIHLTTNSSKKV